MKYIKTSLVLFFCVNSLLSFGQSDLGFGERWIIGISWTYRNGTNTNTEIKYHEWASSSNIATNLTPSLYFGISDIGIRKRSNDFVGEEVKSKFRMYNAFFQYDFIPQKKSRLFVESSIGVSNYCTCGLFDEPGLRKKTTYLGLGVGYDFPIYKDVIYLDLSLLSYNILNKIETKKPFYQYVIGLNYNFLRKRREK